MVIRNPFLSIVPRETEAHVGLSQKKIEELCEEILKGKSILVINGDYGSGKTIITDKIEKALSNSMKKEHWVFSVDLANQIRGLPLAEAIEKEMPSKKRYAIFIDRFELSDVLSDKDLLKILELISDVTRSGASFILSVIPKTLKRIMEMSPRFKSMVRIHKINPLTYPETREFVVSRLNEVRLKKSDKPDPFSEDELKDIWKKSNGNPRMMLLLLAHIFDIKSSETK